jgi:DNA-binding response OmpR family regulator
MNASALIKKFQLHCTEHINVKKKILIVDDYPAILDCIKYMLEDEGYEVETTADGNNIINRIDNLPDLILLDRWIAGTNGYEIYNVLKSRIETQHIPIILMSADNTLSQLTNKISTNHILIKPFDMSELLGKIAACLTA